MQSALERHDHLFRGAIEAHGGVVFKTVGDAFCAAFSTAPEALEAALAIQSKLLAEEWGETPIRARLCLHSGSAHERDGDYFGPPLNRAARLLSAGHGGQVLLSAAAQELGRDRLPEGASLRDLGLYRLKDLERPERIYQLIAPGLPLEFPPLKTLEGFANNLPQQWTSFVGREKDIAEVKRLLGETRLLTLAGPGGTGKTRLALQAAADVLECYPDGAWLVELAAMTHPSLVPQVVASVLGVREEAGAPLAQTLAGVLHERSLLLIFDNCEHLLDAVAQFAYDILQRCPEVQVLATSREPLGITGEVVYRVPALSAPSLGLVGDRQDLKDLASYEAVRLFVERAAAARPGFQLTDHNASALAQICNRLDGIPLALELAAVRVKALSPEQISARLDDRFHLLRRLSV
jgi:hypothetical protein